MPARIRRVDAASLLHRPDGRVLSWGEYGAPGGVPCFFFHGQPGSRIQARLLDVPATRHGVRVIAPDRPGYGFSSPAPRRRLVDWPEDVAAVADALGVQRFAVAGLSAGGPHALACAWAMPERVTTTVLLSSPAPPHLAPARPFDEPLERLASAVLQRSRALESVSSRVLLWRATSQPFDAWFERTMRGVVTRMPEVDREVVRREEVWRVLVDDAHENLRQGLSGSIGDERVIEHEWGFDPADVRGHVEVWHGDADTQVTAAEGRALAERLPDATLHLHPAGGHYVTLDHVDEILRTVRAAFTDHA
ncbi:MAG TPA: alpha/beta hydrolase [Kineosporiaceae bacterium]|nr:alpha/beta hydrolase [Kineosporiaceae bacterium]